MNSLRSLNNADAFRKIFARAQDVDASWKLTSCDCLLNRQRFIRTFNSFHNTLIILRTFKDSIGVTSRVCGISLCTTTVFALAAFICNEKKRGSAEPLHVNWNRQLKLWQKVVLSFRSTSPHLLASPNGQIKSKLLQLILLEMLSKVFRPPLI